MTQKKTIKIGSVKVTGPNNEFDIVDIYQTMLHSPSFDGESITPGMKHLTLRSTREHMNRIEDGKYATILGSIYVEKVEGADKSGVA